MKTDGLFDFRVVELPFKYYNRPISLYPISDVHFGSPSFAFDRFQLFLDKVKQDKNPKVCLFMGDIFDSLSTTERRFILSSGFHDTTVLKWENDFTKDIKDFLKFVSPVFKDKCLGVFSGNHFYRFSDGTTSDMCVASGLNAPYIGTAGYLILILRYDKQHSHAVKIWCHHGVGDARARQCRANFRCDLMLMGHNHQMQVQPYPEIDCQMGMGGRWKIVQHETKFVRCGSFLKSWEAGLRSYAVDSAMPPAMLGCPRVEIIPRRKQFRVNGKRVDERWVDIEATI